ncbi:MAG: hypothetical protein ACPLW7_05690 [Minisyncoccia bacterium]|jgi:hypothetical protein
MKDLKVLDERIKMLKKKRKEIEEKLYREIGKEIMKLYKNKFEGMSESEVVLRVREILEKKIKESEE